MSVAVPILTSLEQNRICPISAEPMKDLELINSLMRFYVFFQPHS